MMCIRCPEVNQVEKSAGWPRVGPCLLFTVLRVAPGPEKTGAGKHFVLVGRLLLWFCNRHHYQGPWSLCRERGEEGRKGMLFHTVHKGREQREKEMWVLGSVSVCPFSSFLPLYQLLVLPLCPPPVYSWLRPGVTEAVWAVAFLWWLIQ